MVDNDRPFDVDDDVDCATDGITFVSAILMSISKIINNTYVGPSQRFNLQKKKGFRHTRHTIENLISSHLNPNTQAKSNFEIIERKKKYRETQEKKGKVKATIPETKSVKFNAKNQINIHDNGQSHAKLIVKKRRKNVTYYLFIMC